MHLNKNKKKMTLGCRVVDGKKTPRWAAGGIDPPQPLVFLGFRVLRGLDI